MTAIAARPAHRPAPGTEEAVFIGRSIRHSLKDPEALLMAIVLPVLLLLLFTFVFGGAIDREGGYLDYVVPGIILLCAGFGASSTAIAVARDMELGIVDRFRTMPIRAWAVLTGHVVSSLARNLVATAVVVLVSLLLGFRPDANPAEWLAAFGLVALWILAITYLFAAIGLAASSAEAANGFGFILLFLPYLSSAFVPLDTLPGWLRWVAENQPVTPIIEAIRGLLMGTALDAQPLLAVTWCAAIIAIAAVWGAVMFRRKAGRR